MVLISSSMGCYGFAVTNYLNFGGDKGSWVYDRIIIVRCDNVIPENRQDKQLVEHLLEEKEYIVSLAIRCLRQVIKNGYRYSIPASCKLLNTDYQVANNSFLSFYNECVIERPIKGTIQDKCTTRKFYDVYEAWTRDNNNGYKETKQEVNKILNKKGKGETKKTGGYWYYKDITLNEATKKEYESIYNPNQETDINFDNDVPNSDKSRSELGLDSDNSEDFVLKYMFGDLRPSEETLREAGILDVNVSNDVVDTNNENV